MNRIIGIIMLSLLLGISTAKADLWDKVASSDRLPTVSLDFLNTHFSNVKISYVEIEKYFIITKGYEVILTDGTEIYFSRNGEWKEVESRSKAVPLAIVPTEVSGYIHTNYPGKEIVSIEREARKWEVKLNNDMELTFNKEGKLIDMDID